MRKKYLAAGLIGLALVAGQAAASEGDVLRLGDRVGSSSASQNNLRSVPVFGWIAFASFAAFIGYELSDHGGHSASP